MMAKRTDLEEPSRRVPTWSRRDFLAVTAGAGLVGIAACGKPKTVNPVQQIAEGFANGETTVVPAATLEPLNGADGSVVVPAAGTAPSLVVSRRDGKVQAFLNLCTHAACPLVAGSDGTIRCHQDCGHGSVYSAEGEVVRGPSLRPLFRLQSSSEDGGALKVKLKIANG
ncbi:Rieske 2Fe-2S domain-containing protein [Candidatus Poribacteria bacterium]|nr:Rieske 2Fe-2S domain-containing protein [Candidatus Poribacteria bacterium]